MAYVWLVMHGWSTIPEFYCLMCFFNLILKLCLYCKEIIPLLLFFRFWSCVLTFLLLIPFNFMDNYFCPKSNKRRQEQYLGTYIADLEQLISNNIVWRMLKEYLHKTLCGKTEIDKAFCNLFVTCIQHVYIELFYIETYLYIKPF